MLSRSPVVNVIVLAVFYSVSNLAGFAALCGFSKLFFKAPWLTIIPGMNLNDYHVGPLKSKEVGDSRVC